VESADENGDSPFGVLPSGSFQGVFFPPCADTSLNDCGRTESFVVVVDNLAIVGPTDWEKTKERIIAFK
jgi:hypothetical protein